ncbi:hypothetical protein EJB05_45680, partial [Eragrostis curvula]
MQQPPAEMHPAVDASNSAAPPAPDAAQAPVPAATAVVDLTPDPSSQPPRRRRRLPRGPIRRRRRRRRPRGGGDEGDAVEMGEVDGGDDEVGREPQPRHVAALQLTFISHVKTGPSFTEAAMGRLAQGTKVLAEGGYEKIFKQTFEVLPEEQLKVCYACYLSTSAGPVMGVLYISTAKIAFCSDNPLSYKAGNKTEWSYYKVVIPLHQLRTANPSVSKVNPAEKYIQVVSVEGHEFWFMGFLMYDKAVTSLQEALASARELQP